MRVILTVFQYLISQERFLFSFCFLKFFIAFSTNVTNPLLENGHTNVDRG